MRFVVMGAGAIGGSVGGRLFQQGFDVTLVARGEHGACASSRGWSSRHPDETVTLPVPAVGDPAQVSWEPDARRRCRRAARRQGPAHRPGAGPAQRGAALHRRRLHAERRGERAPRPAPLPAHLRHVRDVPGQPAATGRRPGALGPRVGPARPRAASPSGIDEQGQAIADAIATTTFQSVARPDIMRWKYRKLLMNLANAVEALSGPGGRFSPLGPGGPARGQGGAGRGRDRRRQLGGGPRAARRLPADGADGVGGVAGRIELAEPGPRRGLDRGRVPQR